MLFFPNSVLTPYINEDDVVEANNRLKRFIFDDVLDVYVQRVFFDGFIGLRRRHGMLSDIDMITIRQNGTMNFLEVKEKDLARNGSFGMDVHRINELVMLSNVTQTPVYYIVKQINNQTDREFIAWRSIEIHSFNENAARHTVNGGFGMRNENSSNPTRLCLEEHFITIN